MPATISMQLLDLAGKAWTLPNTVIGIALGVIGYVVGLLSKRQPRVCLGNNAIQFLNCPLILSRRAMVVGNAILYAHNAPPESCGCYGDPSVNTGLHEKAHTYQFQVLGPLFLPMYLLAGGFSGPRRNPLERAAQNYGSGRGSWWPW